MFLRGTGASPVNSQVGPSLRGTQGDQNKQHWHAMDFNSSVNGQHNHTNGDFLYILKSDGQGTSQSFDFSNSEPNISNFAPMLNSGEHSLAIIGNTKNSGESESRPVNYGVNYIIKL